MKPFKLMPFKLQYFAPDGRLLFQYGAYDSIPAAAAAQPAAEAIRRARHPHSDGGVWRTVPTEPIKVNPLLSILSAETAVRQAQEAIDGLDSLNAPPQWGEIDIAQLRAGLVAERDEYESEAAYWRAQSDQQLGSGPASK
jgi:hypothetical protein